MVTTPDNWHNKFDPKEFLSRVDLARLIEKNQAYNEDLVTAGKSLCILCNEEKTNGLLLNDKSFICEQCFSRVSAISYLQKYEQLRRDYLISKEARRLAWESFRSTYEYTSQSSSLIFFGWASILVAFVHPAFLFGTGILLVLGYMQESVNQQKVKTWQDRQRTWERNNPEPQEPELKHFHDPAAELSGDDKIILRIFDHWPGYPPFWQYLRSVVTVRDSHRCQVTGCPSRLELHVHHMQPVSQGGTHAPNNLVSLCVFHHALEPERGHERIWGNIKTQYFTLVCDHERSNRSILGTHAVRTHLRRLKLITNTELLKIVETYGFACPRCNHPHLKFTVLEDKNKIEVICPLCEKSVLGPQELAEETGPRLTEILKVGRNQGRWKARWDMLSVRTGTIWGTWSGVHVKEKREAQRTKISENAAKPMCPRCGVPMRIIRPKPGNTWKSFWGCSQFRATGCRGSAPYVETRRN